MRQSLTDVAKEEDVSVMSINVWKPISEVNLGGQGHQFTIERPSWRMKSSTWVPTAFVIVSGGRGGGPNTVSIAVGFDEDDYCALHPFGLTCQRFGMVIRWLGPLGRMWAPAIMPLPCFVFCMAVSLGFCTLIHLQYILWLIVRINGQTIIYGVVILRICNSFFHCVNSALPCVCLRVRSASR